MAHERDSGSLDMLLDTMCNTFGGVCFIALMIALLSATLPQATDEAADLAAVETMAQDQHLKRLERERDELNAAIAHQKRLLATNATPNRLTAEAYRDLEARTQDLERLRDERREYEDRLAKRTTASAYSKREAARLERLLDELNRQLQEPPPGKKRVVRTPVERTLAAHAILDVCLWHGRFYWLDNAAHAIREVLIDSAGKRWRYTLRPTGGYVFTDETFLATPEFRQIAARLEGKAILRIWAAETDFPQLCALRDEMIRRRKLYNWHPLSSNTLEFVEGYDGRAQ